MPRPLKRAGTIGLALAAIALIAMAVGVWVRARSRDDPNSEAMAAYARGDWQGASLLAHRRLKQAPDDPAALLLTARASARRERDDGAVAIYSRVPAGLMKPEDDFLLGRALSRMGRIEPALTALETARAGKPDDPEALDLLCRLYYQMDRSLASEEAATTLTRFPAWEARGSLLLGLARAELDDPAGEAQALSRWLELDPDGRLALPDPAQPLRRQLAAAWLRSGRPAEARRVLDELLATGPDPEASWLLSRTYLQEKEWSRAESALDRAASWLAGRPSPAEPAPRIGAARCAACHREESQAVLASHHAATVFRPADLHDLRLPDAPVPDPGNPDVTHAFRRDGEALRVETHTDSRVLRAVIEYAFGSRGHLTTFVGRDDHNRPVMLRISAHGRDRQTTWSLSAGMPPRPALDHEYLGHTLVEGDGVRRCLTCHTTSFRAFRDRRGPESVDHSIGCETCHGPGGHHDLAVAAGFPDPAIGLTRRSSPAEIDAVCARCHGLPRMEVLSLPQTSPALYRFASLTLSWSRCYTQSQGALGCATCHDPHKDVETSVAINETRCLSCHSGDNRGGSRGLAGSGAAIPAAWPDSAGAKPATRAKASPCPVNPTKGCLACHMPRVWDKETFAFKTDHDIRVRHDDEPRR